MRGAAIVLQARMGSSRLPGKSLALIGGRTVLAHCIERLRIESDLPLIVATTTDRQDDAIVCEAQALRALVVRGAATDVLSRYLLAAATFGLSHLVRATADNPAVELGAPVRTLAALRHSSADYAAEEGLPVGAGVEALTVAALRRAGDLTHVPYDREHVTPYLRRAPGFRAVTTSAPRALRRPDLRLTVDTAADLAFVRSIHAGLGRRSTPAPLTEIITMADQLMTRGRPRTEVGAR